MSNQIATVIDDRLEQLVTLVTNSVTSPHSKRAYRRAITDFIQWMRDAQPDRFSKRVVQYYIQWLVDEGTPPSSINQRLTAIRRLAIELADNAVITEQTAQAIQRVTGIKQSGNRIGNWLTKEQAAALISAPDRTDPKGLRDRALLAVMLGCGLRRGEVTRLDLSHLQQRESRWVIVDLVGKRNKRRSVPMPSWAKAAIDQWVDVAGIHDGAVFRPMRRGGNVQNGRMTEQAIWNTVTLYAKQIGVDVSPHDLRRTFAKLARKGGSELDQIQLSLGHDSVQTTQRYVGDNQKLHGAPCDMLGIEVN